MAPAAAEGALALVELLALCGANDADFVVRGAVLTRGVADRMDV
jgi:hypothetical protein